MFPVASAGKILNVIVTFSPTLISSIGLIEIVEFALITLNEFDPEY